MCEDDEKVVNAVDGTSTINKYRNFVMSEASSYARVMLNGTPW